MNRCLCGCGLKCKSKFLRGHNGRGKHPSSETVEKIRNKMQSYWNNFKIRSIRLKALKSLWKDPEKLAECARKTREAWKDPLQRAKRIKGMKEAQKNLELKTKKRKASRKILLEQWGNPQKKAERIKSLKKAWANPIVKTKRIKIWAKANRLRPNKLEKRFNKILQETLPGEYKLNVKANIITFAGKIPDFVNVNSKKKLIELYGDYWHKGDDPCVRINYFKKFMWDTLVVWESELKDEITLKKKLMLFN